MIARLALAVLGSYVALVGAAVHRHGVDALGVEWPWGLALALGATAAVAVAAGRVVRLGASWFAIGWSVVLLAQSLSPSGSYFVAADALGYTYSLLGLGALGTIIVRNSRVER